MLDTLLERNLSFIKNKKSFRTYKNEIPQLVKLLNHKKIVMVSGLRSCGKTNLIHSILKSTQSFDDTFYFNNDIDILQTVKDENDLITIFDIYVRIYDVPKMIILQNTESIKNIKQFIHKLIATKKYKIILVGNNVRGEGIPEFECFPQKHTQKSISSHIYGGIPEVNIIDDVCYKSFLLEKIQHEIIVKDILEPYNIKNISLFYHIISYIGQIHDYVSTREVHRQLQLHGIEISLLTLIDYINAGINTKLLKKCNLYDIKTEKEIGSKAMYYFGDTGILYTLSPESHKLSQNTLYIELQSSGYTLHAGKSGRFQFDFYAQSKDTDFCIAYDLSNDKNEIRKTARKLAKVGGRSKKYIIVESKNSLGMRKFVEEGVEILELSEFIAQ